MIDISLVSRLIATQFPKWADLPIRPVACSGWDNRTFHLGDNMVVRLPGEAEYSTQIEKEYFWLPKLAPQLPLPIPTPLAIGHPALGYLWHWSVYQWLEGNSASVEHIVDLSQFATTLAEFLIALQQIDTAEGPIAGQHNFYRGGSLETYDAETQQAIGRLGNKINAEAVLEVWNISL